MKNIIIAFILLCSVLLPAPEFTLQPGSEGATVWSITVDGDVIDEPAFLDDDGHTVWIPLRTIAESLGMRVVWNERNRMVTLDGGVRVFIGDVNYQLADGSRRVIDDAPAPIIISDFTYVPIDFFRVIVGSSPEIAFEGITDLLTIDTLDIVMLNPVADDGNVKITWRLEDESGRVVLDYPLIYSLTVTLDINDGDMQLVFPRGLTSETFTFPPGDYEAFLSMQGGEDDDIKHSNKAAFTVTEQQEEQDEPEPPPDPIALLPGGGAEIKLTTILSAEGEINLRSHIVFSSRNEPLTVTFAPGNWQNIISLNYNSRDRVIVKALSSGTASAEITVTAEDGSHVTFRVDASVANGLIYIAAIIAVTLLIGIGVPMFLYIKKPYLDTPFKGFAVKIKALPGNMELPQTAEFSLDHVKSKRNLRRIISGDEEHGPVYLEVLRDIDWFLTGTELSAKRKTNLEIKIPVNQKYTVEINGKKQTKPNKWAFRNDREFLIKLTQAKSRGVDYEIVLGEANSATGAYIWG